MKTYALPEMLTEGRDKVEVRFEMASNQWTAIFEARIFKTTR